MSSQKIIEPGLRLSGARVFLGGPIQHALLPAGFSHDLRQLITAFIATFEAAGATVFSAHRTEEYGKHAEQFTPAVVSVRDLKWMRECDIFIPVLPLLPDGTLMRTDGTHIEIGWATALGRPVILVTRIPFVDSASHLLKGIASVSAVKTLDIDDAQKSPQSLVEHALTAINSLSLRREPSARALRV